MFRAVRGLLNSLDRVVFRRSLSTLVERLGLALLRGRLLSSEFNVVWSYEKPNNDLLTNLASLYGTDKGSTNTQENRWGWPVHSYTGLYSQFFHFSRANIKYVFECGIGTTNSSVKSSMGSAGSPGASLRMWRDYFPNALIIGADIDSEVLFAENRIKTYFVDQLDRNSVRGMWAEVNVSHFDLMIDDGLHTFDAGVTLFEESIHKLAPGGIYVIEDVSPHSMKLFREYFSGKEFQVSYYLLSVGSYYVNDNNLIVVRKRDILTPAGETNG